MQKIVIAPSILSANFACLGEEIEATLKAGADWIHFDVMDNHYVPNLTVGPVVCKSLRDYGITAPIDVHLMVDPIERLIKDFAEAGASLITFHPEVSKNVNADLQLIHKLGCKAGLAFNPKVPFIEKGYNIEYVDLILLMSVEPGFGGQQFIPSVLPKISIARKFLDTINQPIRLAIDGGITLENIEEIIRAGADTIVAGSAIFKSPSYSDTITKMKIASTT